MSWSSTGRSPVFVTVATKCTRTPTKNWGQTRNRTADISVGGGSLSLHAAAAVAPTSRITLRSRRNAGSSVACITSGAHLKGKTVTPDSDRRVFVLCGPAGAYRSQPPARTGPPAAPRIGPACCWTNERLPDSPGSLFLWYRPRGIGKAETAWRRGSSCRVETRESCRRKPLLCQLLPPRSITPRDLEPHPLV